MDTGYLTWRQNQWLLAGTSLYSSPFWLLSLSSATSSQSLSADWHAFPSWLLRTFGLGNVPYLFFPYVSWWGKSHPYQIFRSYHYLPMFLFALSILCLGLRRATQFRNRKSRDRQAATVQGTEETLKKNVSCVVSWFGFGVASADLFPKAWRGTAWMPANRVWNIWGTPVDWFAFLICWFPAIQHCKNCRPCYNDYSHKGTFWCYGTNALLSIRRTPLILSNAYWYFERNRYFCECLEGGFCSD